MSAKSNFKAAVVKAKRLYKTGRYKTFANAVKAAYKKTGHKKRVGAVKRKAAPKRRVKKKHHTWGVVHEHKRRVSGPQTVSGLMSAAKKMIADKIADKERMKFLAKRKTDKRHYQKEISALKAQYRKLK